MQARTLIIASHMDDETLSCGALIQRRLQQKAVVQLVVLSGRRYPDADEKSSLWEEHEDFLHAIELLRKNEPRLMDYFVFNQPEGEPYAMGYYKPLGIVEEMLDRFKPTEVVLPSPYDLNQDHRHYADIGRIALRPANLGNVRRVMQAVAFDSQWREHNYYIPFSRDELDVKLQAMACYRRESRALPHTRAPENIEAFHRVMGSQVGELFAEPYDLIMTKEN